MQQAVQGHGPRLGPTGSAGSADDNGSSAFRSGLDGGDGTAAKITQLQDLGQDAQALLFEGGEGI